MVCMVREDDFMDYCFEMKKQRRGDWVVARVEEGGSSVRVENHHMCVYDLLEERNVRC